MSLRLKAIHAEFAVCKLESVEQADLDAEFVFISKTDEEISLVCETGRVPPQAIDVEKGWRMFKVEGILDFGMVGVIAGMSKVLATAEIPIFVISTFNTDYILFKNVHYAKAATALEQSGYSLM